MKCYYQNTAPIAHRQQDAQILLSAEQIVLLSPPPTPKNEQNTIIRLAASIKKYGILEPLSVKLSTGSDGFPVYELIDGARRYRAAALAGVGKIPCNVLSPADKSCLRAAYILQLRQENPHFFALAEAFSRLLEEYQMTQEEIARKMGLSQSAVANKLRLLRLSPEERHAILAANLTERHARAILRIPSPLDRAQAIAAVHRERYNVAKTEALVEQYLAPKSTPDHAENAPNEAILPQNAAPTVPQPLILCQTRQQQAASEGCEPPTVSNATTQEPQTARPERSSSRGGIAPKKFALRDLNPLYTSIERTLGIFEKTGVSAEYSKREDEREACIVIRIPKQR